MSPASWPTEILEAYSTAKSRFYADGGTMTTAGNLVVRGTLDGELVVYAADTAATHAIFHEIVLEGAYAPNGMPRFDDVLSGEEVEQIHSYLIDLSAKARQAEIAQQTPDGQAR